MLETSLCFWRTTIRELFMGQLHHVLSEFGGGTFELR